MKNQDVVGLFPNLDTIPEVYLSEADIHLFFRFLEIPINDSRFEHAKTLLIAPEAKLFRYLFTRFLQGGYTRESIANKTNLDKRVVYRYLDQKNLILLFYWYEDQYINVKQFFELLKREKITI